MNVIIPPHPTPPINVALRTDVSVHEHYINIAVRRASRVAWRLSSHPTPPHPTPPINLALRTDVSVHEHYINIAVRCASRVTWTLSSHPTTPHPTHQRRTAYRCQRARTLHQHRSALCITRNMNVIIPPHPTHQRSTAYRCQRARTLHQHRSALCITRNMNVIIPPHQTMIYVVKNAQKHAVPMGKAHKKVRVYRSTEPTTKLRSKAHRAYISSAKALLEPCTTSVRPATCTFKGSSPLLLLCML